MSSAITTAVATARADERAAIVAWMIRKARNFDGDGEWDRGAFSAIHVFADHIERGQHHTTNAGE